MQRIPEVELMDDPSQALAYARADFSEVNQAFVERFLRLAPTLLQADVVDLGCGPADIAIRLCRARQGLRVCGVDGSPPMLDLARRAAATAGLAGRLRLVNARIPGSLPGEHFDAILSNSLLHHLPAPAVFWQEIRRLGRSGVPVLVMDLRRPPHARDVAALVSRHAGDEHPLLQRDFRASLGAAFTLAEVQAQLRDAGLRACLGVEAQGDRHLVVSGRLPATR